MGLARGWSLLYQTIQSVVRTELAQVIFLGTKKILHSANLQDAIPTAGFLHVPPKSSFKKLLLGTGLWQYAKWVPPSPEGLKDAECKKGQLSHRPPILYVPVVDIVTPKEEPQVFKIKCPDTSHLSMPIYSHGNNKLLRSSEWSNTRSCPRSAECSPRLLSWLGNPFGTPRNSAINPIPDLLNSGILIGILFFLS